MKELWANYMLYESYLYVPELIYMLKTIDNMHGICYMGQCGAKWSIMERYI